MDEDERIDQWINEHTFYLFKTSEVICVSSFGVVLEENLMGIHDENLKKKITLLKYN